MIKINISGLTKNLFEETIIDIKTYSTSIIIEEVSFSKSLDKNIEILTINLNNCSHQDINTNIFNHNESNTIFYSFIQNLDIGININSQFKIIDKNIFISDNFQIIDSNTGFKINPINIQVSTDDIKIYISLSYAITIKEEDTNITVKESTIRNLTENTINNDFTKFDYIDINKEFI